MDALGDLLVQEAARQLNDAVDTVARCMAALNPTADEEKIAKMIEDFKKLIDKEMPERVLHWQRFIREKQSANAAEPHSGRTEK